jgi:hypothetical protein
MTSSVTKATEIAGGQGFYERSGLERLFRDARMLYRQRRRRRLLYPPYRASIPRTFRS